MADDIQKKIIVSIETESNVQPGVDDAKKSLNELNNVDTSKSIRELKKELSSANDEAKKIKKTFGENSKEYADASKKVTELKNQLDSASKVDLTKSVKSFKTQILEAKAEATKAFQVFGAGSEEYTRAVKKLGTLTEAQRDFNQTIQAFNPANKLQAIVGISQGAVGAVQGVAGAMALLGVNTDDVGKTIIKLQGLMALSGALGSIDEIKDSFSNLGRVIRESTIVKGIDNAATAISNALLGTRKKVVEEVAVAETVATEATEAQTVAQQAQTVAVEGTSVAFKVLKTALIASGIGAIIAGISLLIPAISNWIEKTNKEADAQRYLNEIQKEAVDSSTGQIARIQELYNITQDVTQSLHNRRLATQELIKENKENNEKTGEHTKLEKDLNGVLIKNDTAITALTESLYKQAYAKAALSQLEKSYTALIEAQTASLNSQTTALGDFLSTLKGAFTGDDEETKRQQRLKDKRIKEAQDEVDKKKQIIEDGLKSGQFTLDGLFDKKTKGTSTEDFKKDLAALLADTNKKNHDAIIQRRQDEIDAQAEILGDTKKSFNDKLAAAKLFYQKSKELIDLNKNYELETQRQANAEQAREKEEQLKKGGLTSKQKADLLAEIKELKNNEVAAEQAIDAKYNTEYVKLNATSEKQITTAQADEIKLREILLAETIALQNNEFDKQRADIKKKFQAEIDAETDILRKAQLERIQEEQIKKVTTQQTLETNVKRTETNVTIAENINVPSPTDTPEQAKEKLDKIEAAKQSAIRANFEKEFQIYKEGNQQLYDLTIQFQKDIIAANGDPKKIEQIKKEYFERVKTENNGQQQLLKLAQDYQTRIAEIALEGNRQAAQAELDAIAQAEAEKKNIKAQEEQDELEHQARLELYANDPDARAKEIAAYEQKRQDRLLAQKKIEDDEVLHQAKLRAIAENINAGAVSGATVQYNIDVANTQTQSQQVLDTVTKTGAAIVQNAKDNADKNKAIDKAAYEAKVAFLQATGEVIGQLGQLLNRDTVAAKALALAQIAIDEAVAISGAIRQATKNPANLTGIQFALDMATRIATIVAGIVKAKQVLSSAKVGGSVSTSASSVPSISEATAPVINAQATTSQLQTVQDVRVTNQQDQVIKAYITDRDLKKNEEKSNFLNQLGTF